MHVLWWLLISGIVLAYTVGCTKFFRLLKKANDEVEKTKEIIRNYENVISKPVNEIRYLIRQNLVESVAKERSVNKRVNESIKSLRYHFLFPFFTKKSRRIMTELEESQVQFSLVLDNLMNVTRDRILEISNKEFERVDTRSRDLELHKTNDISLFEKTAVSIMVEIDDALNMLSRNLLEIKHTIKDKIRLDLTNIFNNNKDKLTDLKHFSSDSFEENLPIYVEHKIEKIKESIVDISSLIDDTVVKQEVFSSDLLFEKLNEMNHEPTEIVSSPFLNLEVNKNVYNQINVELQNFENWKQELNFANNIIKNIVILDKELAHLLEIDEGKLAVLPEDMKLERNSILHSTGILAELRYNIDQQKEISNQKLSKYIEKDIEKKQEKFSTFTDRNKEISDSISTYNYFKHKENELNQIELATKIKTKELKDKKKIILKLLKLEEKINLKEFLDDVRSYSIKWYKPSFENKLLVLSASTYFSSDIRFKLLSILGFKHIKENGETYHNALNYFKSADAIYENYELTIDPVAKFGLYLCSNPGSSASIQYLIDIKAHYKKFKPEDKEFAIMALNTLFEYEAKTSPKQSVTTSLLIKNYSKGTVFFPQYSMNLSKLYLNLGRIEEGLKVLEELKDLKLTKKDQFHFHKLKSALHDLEGDFKNTLVELKIALKIGAKEDKNKILNRILKLYLKYEKWKEITEFSTLYEEHKEDINKFKSTINEAIKLAKTELERKKAKNIKLTIAEVETKLKMINTFLKTERQDLVPAFAHNIQEILFYLPDTEKYLHYLGLTFYYEAISYELLLEELERLEGCYKLAEYCFNQTGDYHCLVETKLRRLSLNYFGLDNMQTQTLRDASFQVNIGKFLENIIDITNFKSEKVDSLLTNIGKIIDKVEDEGIKSEYNYILNNREKWKKEMVIKFEVYLFASRIDSNEIRRKIKSIGFNQDEMLNRAVNSTIAVIRRLRPYKNNQIFNFDSLIMELRKNRITNIIFNRISKNSRLQEIFNEMSGMFPPFSKLSLIELTSLLFILATPYLTQEAIDIPKINLNYKTNLESIIETFTIDTVSDWINFANDQFIACLIYAAPVLIFFGVRQDE